MDLRRRAMGAAGGTNKERGRERARERERGGERERERERGKERERERERGGGRERARDREREKRNVPISRIYTHTHTGGTCLGFAA
jgi:hypothetical protein